MCPTKGTGDLGNCTFGFGHSNTKQPPEIKCLCSQLLQVLKHSIQQCGWGLCHASYRSRKLSGSWCLWGGAALGSLAGHLLPQKLVGIFSFQKLLCVTTGTWHLRNVDDLSTCCPLTHAGSARHHLTSQSPHFTLLNK